MVGEKVNLPKVILYYWMQVFKYKFNPKVKKNLVPVGMLFTQTMRNIGVDVFKMASSVRDLQLKGETFMKMGIANNFPEYAQKRIKRNIKKEPKQES